MGHLAQRATRNAQRATRGVQRPALYMPLPTANCQLPTEPRAPAGRGGFSLVEINLVLLIVGVGLVALLGLFPVGLRQAGQASTDTATALFADDVLNTLAAEAATLTNWTDWVEFDKKVLDGARVGGSPIKAGGAEQTIKNYLGEKNIVIRYQLTLAKVGNDANLRPYFGGRLWRASIRAIDREQGTLANAPYYCTDFVFTGHLPE